MNVEEKAKEYAEKTCTEELKTKYIPDYDLTIYEACELDFKNGYQQCFNESSYLLECAKDMLVMFEPRLKLIKEIDNFLKSK